MQNIDDVQSRFGFRVTNKNGEELLRRDKPLRDYTWSGCFENQEQRKHMVQIYELNLAASVSSGDNLKLHISYSGQAQLTNNAHVVLVCWPK